MRVLFVAASSSSSLDIDINLLSAKPNMGIKAGPAFAPATAGVDQPFAARAASPFTFGVPAFNVELDGD
jgi:hypothetical protein